MIVNNPHSQSAENDIIVDISNNEDVVRFVDHFFNDHGLSSQASRLKIEKLLRFVPNNIIRQKEMTSWIRKNWDKKFYGM